MKLIPALAVAGIIALGTTGSVALTASHEAPSTPVAYVAWHEPEPTHVDAPPIVPVATPVAVRCEEDEPCWDCHTMGNGICGPVAAPEAVEPPVAVAPVYVPPTVYVTGAPLVTGTVQAKQAPVAKPTPVKTPVAVPTVKPTPVATTCPPLMHKDGVNITPPNAPATCVYAQ